MNLHAARSLTAWLWAQHPDIIDALVRQIPRPLGQCISCDIDWLSTTSCFANAGASDASGLNLINPEVSLDPVTLDSSALTTPSFNLSCSTGLCSGSLASSAGALSCIPTLTEADLTPVDVSAVTGPTCTVGCGASVTSVTNTDANTSNALSGVAGFLTSATGLNALAKVASSYFQAQAAQSNARALSTALQSQIVNSQIARATVGKPALPIAYIANGATGATTPVIGTTGGYLPLTASTLSSLTPSSAQAFLAQYGTWLLVGGAAAFLLYAATRSTRT